MAKTAKRKRKPSAATAKRQRKRQKLRVVAAAGTAPGIGTASAVGRAVVRATGSARPSTREAKTRKPKAQTDQGRACWAIREIYPRDRYPRGVPGTVKPGYLNKAVADFLGKHEPAELGLPVPSPRTTERARAEVAAERS